MLSFCRFSMLATLSALLLLSALACRPGAGPISRGELDVMIRHFTAKAPAEFTNFSDFLKEAERVTKNRYVLEALKSRAAGGDLDESQRITIYRLLAVYARARYRNELLDRLRTLVAIPTFRREGVPQHENPAILKLGREIEKIAKDMGLEYRNTDNRIFEVILRGQTKEDFGIYTHGDVVPADAKLWRLPDGTRLDPYRMKIIGDRIYGRGTEDDKCSIVAAMYAMRAIKESKLPLRRTIRLMIETTEETGSQGIQYYKKKHKLPAYNVVLDSYYPVVTAEKGYGSLYIRFPLRKATGRGAEIIRVRGAKAVNIIPGRALVVLRSDSPARLKQRIDTLAGAFARKHGGNFRFESNMRGREVRLTFIGTSAHASDPNGGVNPVSRAFVFLHSLDGDGILKKNHYTDAAALVATNMGLDFYGRALGVDYRDDFMGPLTIAVTQSRERTRERDLEVGVNLRMPRGKSPKTLKAEIAAKLEKYRMSENMSFKFEHEQAAPMFRNAEGRWLRTLLDIFASLTGRKAEPVSSSGATTARELPNGVNFGPAMPGTKYRGHTINEFKRVANFYLDVRMFTEMLLRIANLPEMQ